MSTMRGWTVSAGSALAVAALIGGGAFAANQLGDEPAPAPKDQEPVQLVEPVESTFTVAEETTTLEPAPEPTPTAEPEPTATAEPAPAPEPVETTEEQTVTQPEPAPTPEQSHTPIVTPERSEPEIRPGAEPSDTLTGREGAVDPAP